MKIVGIAGSLRSGSYNAALLRAAHELHPDAIRIADISGIPLYNGDVEAEDFPTVVSELQRQLHEADGLLLVSPEYNNSLPGVLKNAIDWLSRPSEHYRKVFAGKPTGLLGVSPGGFGTAVGQTAWLPVLRALQTRLWTGGRLLLSRAAQHFDEQQGRFDKETLDRLADYLEGFLAYCAEVSNRASTVAAISKGAPADPSR